MTFQSILSIKTASYANTVRLSVMPKGVEHWTFLTTVTGVFMCDFQ